MGFYCRGLAAGRPAARQLPDRPAQLAGSRRTTPTTRTSRWRRRARWPDSWPERGPTWSSVFQTVEGGLGYWAGNHFRYGPPKFSMNATPQCYDYEVGSPGWSFFYSNEALPDDRLGIAQLSNRLLIPPDALPFEGNPNGEFLGYTWMALPFTDPTTRRSAHRRPELDLLPERRQLQGPDRLLHPGDLEQDRQAVRLSLPLRTRPRRAPRHHGRRRDGDQHRAALRRPGRAGRRLLEDPEAAVPGRRRRAAPAWCRTSPTTRRRPSTTPSRPGATAARPAPGASTSRAPGSRQADHAHDALRPGRQEDRRRRDASSTRRSSRATSGACSGSKRHQPDRARSRSTSSTSATSASPCRPPRCRRKPGCSDQEFKLAAPGAPYTSPATGAWTQPGPTPAPSQAKLADGSVVTYSWYRFVDQPSFQQYDWSEEKKAKLQAFVEKLHAHWPIDRDYMAPPTPRHAGRPRSGPARDAARRAWRSATSPSSPPRKPPPPPAPH